LTDRLIDLLEHADEITLARMRPYELARRWGVSRRQALELFLHATRAGLLTFRWEIVCPLCRGPHRTTDSLRDLQKDVHCESCNIDFTANFDRFVELTFRPGDAIRPIEVAEYCVGGPQVTPHIVVQQRLAPGERRTVEPVLEEGRHRLRTAALAGGRYLHASDGGRQEIALRAEPDGWTQAADADEAEISTRPALRLENATDSDQLFVIERMAWTDDAATAAEVTALQCFRDLFASEVLRPSESISVGSLAVLFTDLRGSTRLYREIGDAPAFGRVRDHFDVLRDAIVPEGGAIVKTIGDAVMAVFPRAVGAVRAVLRAQDALASASAGQQPLCLKAGIHYGPCLAVNLNERLDYFGSTVNLAARLGDLAATGGLVVSGEVRHDPEVAALVEGGGIVQETLRATIKGFEGERPLWRLSRSRI
ncbi:MAG: adenylate/guanylate cyclase domain-containing protein, partial [Gemmatimonadetes bacterium]|nr:adenylate/guanylate cyclase domain-containing protein [Gemmatimonadota bacterium]